MVDHMDVELIIIIAAGWFSVAMAAVAVAAAAARGDALLATAAAAAARGDALLATATSTEPSTLRHAGVVGRRGRGTACAGGRRHGTHARS